VNKNNFVFIYTFEVTKEGYFVHKFHYSRLGKGPMGVKAGIYSTNF